MPALPKTMSLDEFLSWEERQELRYEYDGAHVRAMTGGTHVHPLIQANLIASLHTRLRGGPCHVIGSELKLRTTVSVRYPDAMVLCSPPERNATTTSLPVVLFEILSPSSAGIDLGAKNAEYQTLASVRRYVVLRQDAVFADVFFRNAEDEWKHEPVGADDALKLPEIQAEIPLSAIYEGVPPP